MLKGSHPRERFPGSLGSPSNPDSGNLAPEKGDHPSWAGGGFLGLAGHWLNGQNTCALQRPGPCGHALSLTLRASATPKVNQQID